MYAFVYSSCLWEMLLLPLSYSVRMYDIYNDAVNDRDCRFDMFPLTTWGPGGDRDGDMLVSEIYHSFYIAPISY